MALTEEGGVPATMLVAPTSGMPYYAGSNNSGFGGDGWWIILLFILLAGNGGWGGNAGFGGNNIYPWMNQADITTSGFQNALLNDNITAIRSGISGLSTQMCGGFGDVQMALANGQMNAMQTAFATQNAMNAGFNGIQSQLAQCCCDNRLATCQTQNLVQNEGNATRFADANNTRDIIDSQTRGTQAILDKLCSLELDAKNDTIAQLRAQVTALNLAASQTAQTAALVADNTAQTQYIVNRVAPYPIPAYTVANPVTPASTT